MKKSETKSFMLGILAMALILIAFIAVTAVSVNKSSNGKIIAYADEYDDTITTTASPTTTERQQITTGSGIYNGIIQYMNFNTYVSIIECKSSVSGELEIPETIDGISVIDISGNAFSKCSELDSIILPASVNRNQILYKYIQQQS